ncbi:hypothetical protein [Gulosibacter sp. 10]|uniref:hypothetical protein n=1 Tax=Gulosibacter sp. 10 TaxID=1255570 RepID=UPI00111DD6C6|nr:hypothetical protein [Gulosibacter sp. 10]
MKRPLFAASAACFLALAGCAAGGPKAETSPDETPAAVTEDSEITTALDACEAYDDHLRSQVTDAIRENDSDAASGLVPTLVTILDVTEGDLRQEFEKQYAALSLISDGHEVAEDPAPANIEISNLCLDVYAEAYP